MEKLSRKNLYAFAAGGLGQNMVYMLFANNLLNFILFTKNLNDKQFVALTAIFFGCRLWDGFIDPFLGSKIDGTNSKLGKYKPWLIGGTLGVSVTLLLLFLLPIDGWSFIIFMAIAYILFSTTYSMDDTAYWSMVPGLSQRQDERNLIIARASIFCGIGQQLVGMLLPVFTAGEQSIGGNAVAGYQFFCALSVALMIVFRLITIFGVKESKAAVAQPAKKVTLREMWRVLKSNDQLIWNLLVLFGQNVVSGVSTNTLFNLFIYMAFGYQGTLVLLISVAGGALVIGFTLFMASILKKFKRKTLVTFAFYAFLGGSAAIILSGLFAPAEALFSLGGAEISLRFLGIAFGTLFTNFGSNILYQIPVLHLADCVEYGEWKTGGRHEGIIFSMRSFVVQCASAINQLIVSAILLLLGIKTFSDNISAIEQEVYRGGITEAAKTLQIQQLIAAVPKEKSVSLLIAMFALSSFVFFLGYVVYRKKFFLDEAKYEEILTELNAPKI